MRIKDPTEWFDDLTVQVDDEDIIEQAQAMEPTLLHSGYKSAAAAWVAIAGVAGGAFGGFTLSPEVRSSFLAFLGYLAAGVLLLRVLAPLTQRIVGTAVAWQAALAFFWTFLLAYAAVLGGRVDATWLAYLISIGGGLFIGMMYGAFPPGLVKQEELWMAGALLLAPTGAGAATALYRRLAESASVPALPTLSGAIAALVLMLPMAALMARLWNEAHGLASMGKLYLHNGNFTAKAVAYLDRAVALAPRDADLYKLRGIAYTRLGDSDRAAADWRKVMELTPDTAAAQLNRGVEFVLQGAADAAIECYDRALALRPNYAKALANRAFAHHLKGEQQRALADCARALELEPRLSIAHVNRGHALAAIGEHAAAISSFELGLEMRPDRATAEEAKAALERLHADGEVRERHE